VAKLQVLLPLLLAIHCIAHRLALACKDASNEVDYVKKTFLSTVLFVANWFDNSPVRDADLKQEQLANGEAALKMIKALAARWLSSDRAVQALKQSLGSVIKVMESDKRKKDPTTGAQQILKSWKFIATLELFADFLPELSPLSRVF